jgi:hypothetical protein
MSLNKSRKYSKKKKRQNSSWLPILAVLGGLVLIGLAFFALRGNSTPKAQIEVKGSPSLKVDKDKVDLGEVTLGKPVEVSFQLTNVGDQTLRFSEQPYVEVVEGC